MIEGRDIICISPGYWDSPWITHQQFMRLLARKNRILYVEPPLSYIPLRYPERWKKVMAFRQGAKEHAENLWIITCPPSFPFKRSFNVINRTCQKIVLSRVKKAADILQMRDPILWVYSPSAVELAGKLKESFLLYHCIDEFEAFPWGRKSVIISQEKRMLQSADLTVTCSVEVFKNKKRWAKSIINVPNGVDFDHYHKASLQQTPIADEMKKFSRGPVIGFSGVLDDRIDVAFLTQASQSFPEYDFVLVGPLRRSFNALKMLRNVHLLGNKPVEELPSYIKGFDVCLIPYALNDFVRNISPTKLFEYLAAGKPVVSPPIKAVEGLKDVVMIGRDRGEMVALIEAALADTGEDAIMRRTAIARNNTWIHRVDAVSREISSLEDICEA